MTSTSVWKSDFSKAGMKADAPPATPSKPKKKSGGKGSGGIDSMVNVLRSTGRQEEEERKYQSQRRKCDAELLGVASADRVGSDHNGICQCGPRSFQILKSWADVG